MANVIDVILKTINEVQSKNSANPKQETADPSVFDLLRGKLGELDAKTKQARVGRGKSPHSIFDLIKKEIGKAQRANKKDPNVPTADSSIFDNILKKVEQAPQRQATTGIKKVIQDYNLQVQNIPQQQMQQVHNQYLQDRKNFDKQYAQAIFDLSKQYR